MATQKTLEQLSGEVTRLRAVVDALIEAERPRNPALAERLGYEIEADLLADVVGEQVNPESAPL